MRSKANPPDPLFSNVYVFPPTAGGATLKRRGDAFRWKRDGWVEILELARQFGWQPAGTAPPRGIRKADWDSNDYRSWSRQQVTAEDSLRFAAALAKALKQIPTGPISKPPKSASKELEQFYGIERDGLADFVKFCRRGAFRITDDVCD